MSYTAAIEQLSAMGPELFTRPGQPRRKFSLAEIGVLLAALGNPQRRVRAVLIAGTNGKGSTASTLASILTAAGVRTGLYTSPHLERVNERIRIDGVEITDDAFASLYFRVHDTAQELVLDGRLPQLPSFFEILTAQALIYFAEAEVELAVLEVGMGGRLDATNVVDPLVSIITDISLDHTEWLGSTITAITREKAGILRRGGTLITLPQHPEANQVLDEAATELNLRRVNGTAYMPPSTRRRLVPIRLRRWAPRLRLLRRSSALISSGMWRWPSPRRWNWPRRTAFLSLRRPLPRGFAGRAGRAGWNASRRVAWNGFWTWRTIPPEPGRCVPGCRDSCVKNAPGD